MNVGHPGTSRFTVDWSARQRGQEQMWKGIGQLLHSVGEQQRQSAEKKSLAEVMAFVGDGQKLLSEGAKRGIPLAKLREAVNIHTALAGKKPDPYTLAPGAARYGPGGAEIARNPAAPKDDRTTFQRQYEYAKSQGFPGTPADWRKAGASQTTINNRMNEGESKAMETAERVAFGMDVLGSPDDEGKPLFSKLASESNNLADAVPIFGNYMVSPSYQKAENALRETGQAILRLETGAAAPPHEVTDIMKRYRPRPGDDESTVRQKWDSLRNRYEIAKRRAGAGYTPARTPPPAAAAAPPQQPAPTRPGNASDRFADAPWRGPPQSAPASMMAAQAQGRPAPGAVRRDQFGGGMSPGGRAGGDEFASPFDASGLAPPPERRQYPFGSMDRTALMGVDLNTLAGDPAALAAYERALDEQIRGIR